MKRAKTIPGLLTAALLAACAGKSQTVENGLPGDGPSEALRAPRPWTSGSRPISEPIDARISNDQAGPEVVFKTSLRSQDEPLEGASPGVADIDAGELVPVKYTTNNAAAAEVFRVLIGEYLDRDYLLDPKVNGPITIDIDEELTKTEILDLVGAVCMVNKWALEDRDGVLLIRPIESAVRSDSSPILQAQGVFESDVVALRVHRSKYISADALKTVAESIMSDGAKFAASGRIIVMADSVRQLNKVSRIISLLDVAPFEGVGVWTYRLRHKTPEDAATTLEKIAAGSRLTSGQANSTDPLVAFVPVTGTDRLFVIARDGSLQPLIREFVAQVDQPSDSESRYKYVYRVQHYTVDDLIKLLNSFYADKIETEGARPPASATHRRTPMRVIADTGQDQLLIYATPSDFADLMATLRAIDRPPQQVTLNGVIAEVILSGSLQYGVEYFLEALDKEGFGILELAGTPGLPAVQSGSAFFVGGDGLAVVEALETAGDVRILSQPRVMVADRGTAKFQVGGETPIVTGDVDSQTQTDGTTGIRRDIEYKETGIILEVQPRINESGLVRLTIKQEIVDVGAQTDLGPEFTKRSIETDVVVPSGQTLLLAGIIRTDRRDSRTKIPFLGNLPLIGLAFQSVETRESRTELFLAVTPTIVNEPLESGQATSEFLASAYGVRDALLEYRDDLPRGVLHSPGAAGERWDESVGGGVTPAPAPNEPSGDAPVLEPDMEPIPADQPPAPSAASPGAIGA